MARLAPKRPVHVHQIAVVDDDSELLRSTIRLFEREGHQVRGASNPAEAIELVRTWRPHLILLDYYMEGGTGADVVRAIREFDPLTQVLLVTGYASEQPARTLLADLDIQGFHDKADGPRRLMILADAALKHYRSLARIDRQRAALRFILEVIPEINRLRPCGELRELAIEHAARLLSEHSDFQVVNPSGLFAVVDRHSGKIAIQATTGRYAGAATLDALPSGVSEAVRAGASSPVPFSHPAGLAVIPFATAGGERGCMVVDAPVLPEDALLVCRLYVQQVLQALDNATLFERATVDPLTGLYRRDFGLQRLRETLRIGVRMKVPTSVILLDVDYFKRLNDSYGHAAGDLILKALGETLRARCRTTDVIARYGGEEVLVVLPATDHTGAHVLAGDLRQAVEDLRVSFEGQQLCTSASLGVATADPGHLEGDELIRRADSALYEAKRGGRNRVCCCEGIDEAA